ncbi:MAG: hypothetical protein ACTSV5_08860 [Promethearchaeota archaeon]
MNNSKSQIHGYVSFKKGTDKLSLLYEDLSDAITENNTKSIWELSKMITRQQFSDENE